MLNVVQLKIHSSLCSETKRNVFIIMFLILLLMFQNSKDDNIRALANVDAFTCAIGVDDYTMYSKSSSLQVDTI